MEQLLQSAAQNGFFALLFVSLFVYTLRTNEKRESKYQQTVEENQKVITSLAEKFEIISHINEDVKFIKECLNCPSPIEEHKSKKKVGV